MTPDSRTEGPDWRQVWPSKLERWQHVYELSEVPGLGEAGGMHLEWEVRDGRAVVVGLYLHGEELTAGTLRALPLQRVIASHARGVAADLGAPYPDEGHRGEPAAAEPTPSHLRAEVARRRRLDRKWQQTQRAERQRSGSDDGTRAYRLALAQIEVERRHGLSAAFFVNFAEAYGWAAAQTSAPARTLADDLGVPISTVHRWTREARLSGALPPARRGVAG